MPRFYCFTYSMITPSHIIYSWALAKKTEPSDSTTAIIRRRTLAFVLGALFPDTPTYLFFFVNSFILGYSGSQMWGDMYFNSAWSIPITLTHSFLVWPILIFIASYFKWRYLRWFSISALLHATVDFCVHTDDAYRHFYPFSNWKFNSPISYYNPSEYGVYVSAFDSLLVIFLLVFLYNYYKYKSSKWQRYTILVVASLYAIRIVAEPLLIYFHPYGA